MARKRARRERNSSSFTQTGSESQATLPQTKKRQRWHAIRLFNRLIRGYLDGQFPTDFEMEKLGSYADIIDYKTFKKWYEKISDMAGVIYIDGKVIFRPFPRDPHHRLVGEFSSQFYRNFGYSENRVLYGQGRTDIEAPAPHIGFFQPESSFAPRNRPYPLENPISFPQPGTRSRWPTIILEIGRTEHKADLVALRDDILGPNTQINVWVGIQFFYHEPDLADSQRSVKRWWMGVWHRNESQAQAQSNHLLPPVCLGQLSGSEEELVSTVRHEVFRIPIWLLFWPDEPPNAETTPPLCASFDLVAEDFRQVILENTIV